MNAMQVFDAGFGGLLEGADAALAHLQRYRVKRAEDSRESQWQVYACCMEDRVRHLEAQKETLQVELDKMTASYKFMCDEWWKRPL